MKVPPALDIFHYPSSIFHHLADDETAVPAHTGRIDMARLLSHGFKYNPKRGKSQPLGNSPLAFLSHCDTFRQMPEKSYADCEMACHAGTAL
jgi:hypothetical protein